MIVEDSNLMIAVITNFIKKESSDIEIIVAHSGEESISRYTENRPDLVFMDIKMPGMDGITALEKIKEINPNAKVVMCTSLKEPEQEKRAKNAGCAGYIMKPFSSKDISDALKANL
jgi:two-component system, chemotaxis family, chemotaxis protein CheY